MKTKEWSLRLHKKFFLNFQNGAFFKFLFNFQNTFIKQFVISKDTLLNFILKSFGEEKVICVNLRL